MQQVGAGRKPITTEQSQKRQAEGDGWESGLRFGISPCVGRSHWRVTGRWIQDCSGADKSIEKVVQNGNDVWTHETVGSGMCFEDGVDKIFVGCKKN